MLAEKSALYGFQTARAFLLASIPAIQICRYLRKVRALTVLVVDDDADSRDILRTWLELWGITVEEAPDATRALEHMLKRPADIVFLDILMPHRDGLWLAERIHTRWPQSALVMVSAVSDTHTAMRAKRLGVVDYVVKPLGPEMLLQAVQRARAALPSEIKDDLVL